MCVLSGGKIKDLIASRSTKPSTKHRNFTVNTKKSTANSVGFNSFFFFLCARLHRILFIGCAFFSVSFSSLFLTNLDFLRELFALIHCFQSVFFFGREFRLKPFCLVICLVMLFTKACLLIFVSSFSFSQSCINILSLSLSFSLFFCLKLTSIFTRIPFIVNPSRCHLFIQRKKQFSHFRIKNSQNKSQPQRWPSSFLRISFILPHSIPLNLSASLNVCNVC